MPEPTDPLPTDPLPTDSLHVYYFTFGSDHLAGRGFHRYVAIRAHSSEEARESMIERYGTAWSFCYDSAERAGVYKYDLIEVDYQTGEDVLTLEILARASDLLMFHKATVATTDWLDSYSRWRSTRRR